MGRARIGISGWTYEPWRGTFYPAGLPRARELAYAARSLSTIEINGTFYSLQSPASYARWAGETPEDFVFSVKAPRFITHVKRLKDVRAPLANFCANGLLRLGRKLGPVLWQLPPSLGWDPGRLEGFLAALPRSTGAAAVLARRHDARVSGRAWLRAEGDEPLRHALEVRHPSFLHNAEFLALARAQGVAVVVADTAGRWPLIDEPTADFAYARLHGDRELYVSGYTPSALERWAARVRAWTRRGDAFVYFDNDVKVRAPYDARSLAHRLGLAPAPGRPPALARIPEGPRLRTAVREGWRGYGRRRSARSARVRRSFGRGRRAARLS